MARCCLRRDPEAEERAGRDRARLPWPAPRRPERGGAQGCCSTASRSAAPVGCVGPGRRIVGARPAPGGPLVGLRIGRSAQSSGAEVEEVVGAAVGPAHGVERRAAARDAPGCAGPGRRRRCPRPHRARPAGPRTPARASRAGLCPRARKGRLPGPAWPRSRPRRPSRPHPYRDGRSRPGPPATCLGRDGSRGPAGTSRDRRCRAGPSRRRPLPAVRPGGAARARRARRSTR